jgi:hypothetical protein
MRLPMLYAVEKVAFGPVIIFRPENGGVTPIGRVVGNERLTCECRHAGIARVA